MRDEAQADPDKVVRDMARPKHEVNIAMVGKYIDLADSNKSIPYPAQLLKATSCPFNLILHKQY